MNRQIKVSIIVPIYNVENYLDNCVQSLLNQSLKEIEIILVDDESPDKCPLMCEEYAKFDNRVKVIHKTNEGQGIARNFGIKNALGEYVAFVDADDYLELDTYRQCYELAKMKHLDSVRFSYSRFNEKGEFFVTKPTEEVEIYENFKNDALYCFDETAKYGKHETYNVAGSACFGIFSLKIIKNNDLHFFSERQIYSEDLTFSLDFVQYASRMGYIGKPFYHYRINLNSTSASLKFDRIELLTKYTKFLEKRFEDYGYPKYAKDFAMGYYVANLRVCCKQVFATKIPISKKRLWFKEQVNTNYMNRIISEYPFKRLPLAQLILFKLMAYKLFFMSYLMIRVYNFIRKKSIK